MKIKEESEKAGLKLNIQKTKIMASGRITSCQIDGKTETDYFLGLQNEMHMVSAAMKLKDACSLEEKLWQTQTAYLKQRHYFADKGPSSQSYGFSNIYVRMWELDHKEGWVPKKWRFRMVVLEKNFESPLDCTDI